MKYLNKLSLILLVIIVATACNKDNEEPNPPLEIETGNLVTWNYITDEGSYDFLINGLRITEDVAYSFGSSAEFEWIKGESSVIHSIRTNGSENDVFSISLPVVAGDAYTSAVVGPSTEGRVVISKNDPTTPGDGNIRVRFMHAYQDLGGLDIYVGGTEAVHKVITNLEYPTISMYIEPAVADINAVFVVTPTGVDPNPDTNIISSTDNNGHDAGKIYLDVFASETTDATSDIRWYKTPQ